jgi:hypothetical protein
MLSLTGDIIAPFVTIFPSGYNCRSQKVTPYGTEYSRLERSTAFNGLSADATPPTIDLETGGRVLRE